MTVFLMFAPLLALIYALPVAMAFLRGRQRQASQDALRGAPEAKLDGLSTVRVLIADPARAGADLALGWLGHDAERVRVFGRFADGSLVEREWRREGLALAWLGSRAGSVPELQWFAVGDPALQLSAHGVLDWSSAEATTRLYTQIAPADAPRPPSHVFHLQYHPVSLAATLLFVLLLGFAVVDQALSPYALVGDHRWVIGLALALIPAALLLYPLFRLTRLPQREALLLPLLLGFAAGMAAIPLLARIDRATGEGDFVDTPYYLDGVGILKPLNQGPPPLQVTNVDDYWAALTPGTGQTFYLRRGGLGLWQVQTDALRIQLHSWYQGQNLPTPRASIN
ncbi:MAG: hypothetical protein JNN30_16925 [Rhodanobacteraceae bacterium]|nr:hypothetical protein [Rhodanobacteraceae bacterium]